MPSGQQSSSRGEIITFYSYKGGTGRTMALANVACLLAEGAASGERVLVVDWDLEAPGLHRFFPHRLALSTAVMDLGLDARPGLIDLFMALGDALPPQRASSEDEADANVDAALDAVGLDRFFLDTPIPAVSILRAGRNDDSRYSQRVGTFDWEALFERCPVIYRRLVERLGSMFRYVLVDSRTGVTDISGICTAMLPEKLVVVFTPNQQSLTGIWDLVGRASAYRRNSDDLRPLLVYPLPSRIEASRQDLRALWRHGDRDKGIVGYQPMFEELFTTTYGLGSCDLSAYFDEVQIQQSADYAYGEEIAVRRSADRFSIANSYRVFVKQLTSGRPPWAMQLQEEGARPVPSAAVTSAPSPAASSEAPSHRKAETAPASPASPGGGPPAVARQPTVFLSYAQADREAVKRIADALQGRGLNIYWDRSLPAGATFSREIEQALDRSIAVVVCWSTASVVSQFVIEEATEGLRRGVLVPVLLDDATVPLQFRYIQSADLRRDFERGVSDVAHAIEHLAKSNVGAPSVVAPQSSARGPILASGGRSVTARVAWATVIVAAVGLIGHAALSLRSSPPPSLPPVSNPAQVTPTPSDGAVTGAARPVVATFPVPDFVGSSAAEAQKVADLLGLKPSFRDQAGRPLTSREGVIASQSPAASANAYRGMTVVLTVAAAATTVPTIVGMTLDAAVDTLQSANLRLGAAEYRFVRDAKPGTIIAQAPEAGARVAVGSQVTVTLAGRTSQRPSSTPRSQTQR